MREHQIIVSLKPDQFQEVQNLAKASGFKSVGLFARQNLLNSLDPPDATRSKSKPERARMPDWKNLVHELNRLHGELKMFVTESLSRNAYLDASPGTESSETYEDDTSDNLTPTKGWRYYDLPTGPVIEHSDLANDKLEELADRTFANSPQLGALSPSKEVDSLYDLLDEHYIARENEAVEESK